MKRSAVIAIVCVVVAVLVAAGVYVRRKYFPKYRWNITYNKNSNEPYGLGILYGLLKDRDEGMTPVFDHAYNEIDSTAKNANLVFIGKTLDADSSAASRLLEFVDKGNCALIATAATPEWLLRQLIPVGDTIHGYSMFPAQYGEINAEGERPDAGSRFYHITLKDTMIYKWGGYTRSYFFDTLAAFGFKPVAWVNDSIVTAFVVDRGAGKIVFHANPIVFTNFHMSAAHGYKHAAAILAQLNAGPIYWDDPSAQRGNDGERGNPLAFMFSHTSLRWAWYLFIVSVALYLIFRSKRQQRVIPLVPRNENASVAHAKTVGTLYFKHGGRRHIASDMYTLFMAELRARYHIFSDLATKDLVVQVAARSGLAHDFIQQLFRELNYARQAQTVTTEDVMKVHSLLEEFYRRRK